MWTKLKTSGAEMYRPLHIDWAKGSVLLLAALLFFCAPSTVFAQDVAVGQATANVLAALVVSATQTLDFGDVYQGIPKSVSKNDAATAAIFDITGAANSNLALYLQLPDYLSLSDGSDRMVVAFSTTDADVDTALAALPGTPASFTGGFADQDPHNLPNNATTGDAGYCSIYLGGKVIPTVDQKTGSYSADIVLTVAYDGT
jgi:hypothetical protein